MLSMYSFSPLTLVTIGFCCMQPWLLIQDGSCFLQTSHFTKVDTGNVSSPAWIKSKTTLHLTFKTSSHSITLIKYSFKSNTSDLNVFCLNFFFFYFPADEKLFLKMDFIDSETLIFYQHSEPYYTQKD